MSIAFVQSTHTFLSSTATFSSNNTAGNFIVVFVQQQSAGVSFSCSDSNGNLYHSLSFVSNAGVSGQIFYAANIASGANTVTISGSPGSIAIHEFSGVNSLDASSSATGSGTSQDSGGATTNFANELLFGFECGSASTGQNTVTAGTGWTVAETIPTQFLTQYQIVSATGTYHSTTTTTSTKGGTTVWAAEIATFAFTIPTPVKTTVIQFGF